MVSGKSRVIAFGVRMDLMRNGPTNRGENFLYGLVKSTSGINCLVDTRTWSPILNCGGNRLGKEVVNCLSAADDSEEWAAAVAAFQASNVGKASHGDDGVSGDGKAFG